MSVPPEQDCVCVVMAYPAFIQAFEQWVEGRGLELFEIPVDPEENLPTYGVRPTETVMAAQKRLMLDG